MVHTALLLCTLVLYTPHTLLCAVALLWHPMLILLALLSSLAALAPLVAGGLLLRVLQWSGIASDTAVATAVLLVHFALQTAMRLWVLHGCLQLQRVGWRRGLLLVRSRVPLVALSIAVGAGFGGASLLVGGGALLAEGWTAQLAIPGSAANVSNTAAKLAALFEPSASCAQLSRIAQAVFQQTFYTCGQVAWTVMLGQAYAAAYPQVVEEANEEVAASMASAGEDDLMLRDGALQQQREHGSVRRTGGNAAAAGVQAEELAQMVLAAEEHLPLMEPAHSPEVVGGYHEEAPLMPAAHTCLVEDGTAITAAASAARPREELEAAQDRLPVASAVDSLLPGEKGNTQRGPRTTYAAAAAAKASPLPAGALHPAITSGLVVESVLAQRQSAAFLTGLAAVGLHLLYVLLPLIALSQNPGAFTPSAAPTDASSRGGCAVFVPLQCVVTLVSVVWGLCIVHCERHPCAYTRLV